MISRSTVAVAVSCSLPTKAGCRASCSATDLASFEGESVEVDAIPPAKLRELVRECVEQHVDKAALERTRKIERLERQGLEEIAEEWSE